MGKNKIHKERSPSRVPFVDSAIGCVGSLLRSATNFSQVGDLPFSVVPLFHWPTRHILSVRWFFLDKQAKWVTHLFCPLRGSLFLEHALRLVGH